ncbi:MAG: Flp pilus assembly complex ATPase component TadA [Kiritimatiellae bacterium]|nr:Flp pilus assembly complex ATPase component TadA [Kiritimatiellia bacterium]
METAALENKVLDILVRRKALDPAALEEAGPKADAAGVRIERWLVDKEMVTSSDMALALGEYLNMPTLTLAHFTPDEHLLDLIPRQTMSQHMVVPLCRTQNMLTVALGDPFDVMAIDEVHALTGMDVVPVVAPEKEIAGVLQRYSQELTQGLEDILKDVGDSDDLELSEAQKEEVSLDEMLEKAEDAPVIRLVNSIMVEGIRKHASDIHIEPMERQLRLRYRVDGVLYESPSPPKPLQSAITSRIKIMGNLDIAERRVPQDGRFKIRALGKDADIRLSVLPTVHGEKIVMRILDKTSLAPNIAALGLDQTAYERLMFSINQPNGMLLVTGPTGSGKTTTLYSALQELNDPGDNIITVEDPVEYQLVGINQVQTHASVGLTFAAALRSILRQDPDIVMVGEIRDSETAQIAVQAALTGHLVLSTLHTNDAAGAIARLLYMGIEPFMIASSVIMTQAQRLYRKLCPACKREAHYTDEVLAKNYLNPADFQGVTFFEPHGCPKCGDIGYKGRGAVMEILLMSNPIRQLVLKNADSSNIRDQAVKEGMLTLRTVALLRVKEGITSVEEAQRVTGADVEV